MLPLLLLLGQGLSSCSTLQPVAAKDVAFTSEELALKRQAYSLPIKKPFLWSIEKNGQISYLFGTIHVGVHAKEELPAMVFDRLSAVDAYVMETDLNGSVQALLHPESTSHAATVALKEKIGESAWARLRTILPLEDEILGSVPPGLLAMLYLSMLTDEGDRIEAMDQVLFDWAKKRGKKVSFLEGAQDYRNLFSSPTAVTQLKTVLNTDATDLIREVRSSNYRVLIAYRQGDLETIEQELNEEAKDDPLATPLIEDRNELWIKRLTPLLTKQSTFVAVGLGHMTGSHSLLKLLEKNGFKVTSLATSK